MHTCKPATFTGQKFNSFFRLDGGELPLNCITLLDKVLVECCGYTGERFWKDRTGEPRRLEEWFTVENEDRVLTALHARATKVLARRDVRHGDLMLTKPFSGRLMLLFMVDKTQFFYVFEKNYVGLSAITVPFWSRLIGTFWRLNDYAPITTK